nr:MAG TPA: hypothetical protein [Bacteriophage sp.]
MIVPYFLLVFIYFLLVISNRKNALFSRTVHFSLNAGPNLS